MHFSVKDVEKMRKKLRKNSNAANSTFEDYTKSYQKKLDNYCFSKDDIEVLLEKIAADYEPFIL